MAFTVCMYMSSFFLSWRNNESEILLPNSEVHLAMFALLLAQDASTPLQVCVFAYFLTHCAPLHKRPSSYAFSLIVYFYLASDLNCFSVHSPIHCAVSLTINCVPFLFYFIFFTVLASLKHFCFQTRERSRATLLLASSPWWSSG